MVYHEDFDFDYNRLKDFYPTRQPVISAVFADLYAERFKLRFRQNIAPRRYDSNWFSFGLDGRPNTDAPNTGGGVRTR